MALIDHDGNTTFIDNSGRTLTSTGLIPLSQWLLYEPGRRETIAFYVEIVLNERSTIKK